MEECKIKLNSEEKKIIEAELMQFAEVLVNEFLKQQTETKKQEHKKYEQRIVF